MPPENPKTAVPCGNIKIAPGRPRRCPWSKVLHPVRPVRRRPDCKAHRNQGITGDAGLDCTETRPKIKTQMTETHSCIKLLALVSSPASARERTVVVVDPCLKPWLLLEGVGQRAQSRASLPTQCRVPTAVLQDTENGKRPIVSAWGDGLPPAHACASSTAPPLRINLHIVSQELCTTLPERRSFGRGQRMCLAVLGTIPT